MTMQNRDYLPLLNSGLNDSSGSSARPSGPLTPNAGRTATETNTLGQVCFPCGLPDRETEGAGKSPSALCTGSKQNRSGRMRIT